MPRQKLSAGKTLDERYVSALGAFRGVMAVDPSCSFILAAGRTGSGKSSFFHSCPYAYVINIDCSSTPSRARAMIWPGVRSDGLPVEIDPSSSEPTNPETGKPVTLSWNLIDEKRKLLIELAQADVPGRPRLVVIDTIDTLVPLLEQHMVDEWNETYPHNMKEDFGELGQGQQYGQLEDKLTEFIHSLRASGYGVAAVCHLGDKSFWAKNGNERNRVFLQSVPKIRDNIWNTLISRAEIVAEFRLEDRPIIIKKKVRTSTGQIKKGPDGKPIIKHINSKKTVCLMIVGPSNENKNEDVKSRYRYLDKVLELNDRRPWDTFETAAREAIAKEIAYTEEE